jgi:hypothetical protein
MKNRTLDLGTGLAGHNRIAGQTRLIMGTLTLHPKSKTGSIILLFNSGGDMNIKGQATVWRHSCILGRGAAR